MATIPDSVARRVLYALETLRSCEKRLNHCRDMAQQFGGQGRYEAEGWQNGIQAEVEQAEKTLTLFRELAPANRVDAEGQIAAWGGAPVVRLSHQALEYLGQMR